MTLYFDIGGNNNAFIGLLFSTTQVSHYQKDIHFLTSLLIAVSHPVTADYQILCRICLFGDCGSVDFDGL